MAANPVPPTPELHLDKEQTTSETIFHCSGKITSSTSHLLQSTVRSTISKGSTIVLDLSNVTYVDSSGLGSLVSLWVTSKRDGWELKFISLSDRVKELFHITGMDKLFATSRFPETPSF
jgi:anti-sigma B factor antagonist